MSRQIDLVAYLYLGYGALMLLVALFVYVVVAGAGYLSQDPDALAVTSWVAVVVAVFLALLAAPSLLGGYGLLRRRAWSRGLVIVLSILSLFNFPLGTALGVYALWVLTREEAVQEF